MSEPGAVLECPQHKMAWEDFDWHPPDDPEKTVRLKRCSVRGCKERPPKSQGGAQRGGGGWRGKSPEELAQQRELAIWERTSIERQTALKAAVDWAKTQTAMPTGVDEIVYFAQRFVAFLTGATAPDAPTATPEPAKAATPATAQAGGIVDADGFWKWANSLKPPALAKDITAWLNEPVHVWISKGHTWAEAQAQVLKMRGG